LCVFFFFFDVFFHSFFSPTGVFAMACSFCGVSFSRLHLPLSFPRFLISILSRPRRPVGQWQSALPL
jgi:hypothetical protein